RARPSGDGDHGGPGEREGAGPHRRRRRHLGIGGRAVGAGLGEGVRGTQGRPPEAGRVSAAPPRQRGRLTPAAATPAPQSWNPASTPFHASASTLYGA